MVEESLAVELLLVHEFALLLFSHALQGLDLLVPLVRIHHILKLFLLISLILELQLAPVKVLNFCLSESLLAELAEELALGPGSQLLPVLDTLQLHLALLLIHGRYHLRREVLYLSLLLMGEVFVELAPLALLFVALAVGVVDLAVVLHLVLFPALALQVLLEVLVGKEVAHLLGLVGFLLQLIDLRLLFTHLELTDALLHVI